MPEGRKLSGSVLKKLALIKVFSWYSGLVLQLLSLIKHDAGDRQPFVGLDLSLLDIPATFSWKLQIVVDIFCLRDFGLFKLL